MWVKTPITAKLQLSVVNKKPFSNSAISMYTQYVPVRQGERQKSAGFFPTSGITICKGIVLSFSWDIQLILCCCATPLARSDTLHQNWEVHFNRPSSATQHAIPVQLLKRREKNCSRQSSIRIPVEALRSSRAPGRFFFHYDVSFSAEQEQRSDRAVWGAALLQKGKTKASFWRNKMWTRAEERVYNSGSGPYYEHSNLSARYNVRSTAVTYSASHRQFEAATGIQYFLLGLRMIGKLETTHWQNTHSGSTNVDVQYIITDDFGTCRMYKMRSL